MGNIRTANRRREALSEGSIMTGKQSTIIEVLEYCQINDLPARVVGKWVWVEFDDKPSADVRSGLKTAGFKWSKRRKQWAHSCGLPCRPARSYRPWDKYQTRTVEEAQEVFGATA